MPASSNGAGQMRTLREHISRLGTLLKFPRSLGIPGVSTRGWAWGWRAAKGAAGGGPPPPGALGTCYLATQKAIWHAGKGFQLYLPPCKYPRVPDSGTLFCTEQYKYPICYNAGVLFLPKLCCVIFLFFFSSSFMVTLYTPLPWLKKKSQMFTLLI